MQCDPIKRKGWLKAITSELKNLIIDNKTFIIPTEVPPGAQVIPTKIILNAKPTAQGTLEKIKIKNSCSGRPTISSSHWKHLQKQKPKTLLPKDTSLNHYHSKQ